MTVLFGVFLLTLVVITAIAIVRTRNLFVAVMLSGIFSLLLAANFFLLDAADVALTEAAVGAGISTVLFLSALALTAEQEMAASANRLTALLVVIVTTLAIIYATFDKPRLGDPEAPVQTHVGPWYLDKTVEYIDIPNSVTAVLGSFRGYDTLGEVFVVLTAGIGVLFLLGKAAPPGFYRQDASGGCRGTAPLSDSANGRSVADSFYSAIRFLCAISWRVWTRRRFPGGCTHCRRRHSVCVAGG